MMHTAGRAAFRRLQTAGRHIGVAPSVVPPPRLVQRRQLRRRAVGPCSAARHGMHRPRVKSRSLTWRPGGLPLSLFPDHPLCTPPRIMQSHSFFPNESANSLSQTAVNDGGATPAHFVSWRPRDFPRPCSSCVAGRRPAQLYYRRPRWPPRSLTAVHEEAPSNPKP